MGNSRVSNAARESQRDWYYLPRYPPVMFSIPRKNVIESDQGFSIEVFGRTGILYTEGTRSLMIDSEVLAGPSGLALYTNSIKSWATPNADEAVDQPTKARIVENIRAAFKFRGFDIHVF